MDLIRLVGVQILGVGAAGLWRAMGTYRILLKLVQATVGLWRSADREREGLDLARHGERAYNDQPDVDAPRSQSIRAASRAAGFAGIAGRLAATRWPRRRPHNLECRHDVIYSPRGVAACPRGWRARQAEG